MGRALAKLLRDLRGSYIDRRGTVIVLFALMLPVVVGGAAFGVETTYWYYKRLVLQAAADASAFSAALERRSGSQDDEVEDAAEAAATDNGFDLTKGSIQVNPQNLNGGGAVEVVLHEDVQRFFTAYFTSGDLGLTARAVATYNSAANACVLALHPTRSKAANFSGSSNLQLIGCSVMANSVASDGLNVQGSAHLTTDCAISAGGVSATSGLTLTECASPITQAPPVGDPYADLPVPPAASCTVNSKNQTGSLSACNYPNGLKLDGTVNLAPGVYLIGGQGLDIGANAEVSGAGVTFYFTGDARADFMGNATIDLSAPTTGAYSGVLFFGNRDSVGGTPNKFNGTADSKLTGAIYFASQEVQYNGNFSGINGCTQVIGRTVEWTGAASVAADCTAQGMRALPVLNIVRLTA